MADIKVSQMGEVLVASNNDLLNLVSYDDQNQTYVSGKVKASTLKSYMVDDLEVSDLYDTTITTPTDNDGLVYDATAQKWENKQITTKEQWKKNGAYNLLPMTYTNHVISGATAIVNADGSVTIDTAGNPTTGVANFVWDFPSFGKVGEKYRLVGCPSGGGANTYYVNIYDNGWNDGTKDYGSGNTFTLGTGITQAVISIRSGVVVDHLTFKPMITTDLNATYADYVPHAKTNGELTEDLKGAVTLHKVTIIPTTNEKWSSILPRVKTAVDSYIATLPSGSTFRILNIVTDGRYFAARQQNFDATFYNGVYKDTMIDGTYFAESDLVLTGGTYKMFLVSSAGVASLTDKSSNNATNINVYLEVLSPNIVQS